MAFSNEGGNDETEIYSNDEIMNAELYLFLLFFLLDITIYTREIGFV